MRRFIEFYFKIMEFIPLFWRQLKTQLKNYREKTSRNSWHTIQWHISRKGISDKNRKKYLHFFTGFKFSKKKSFSYFCILFRVNFTILHLNGFVFFVFFKNRVNALFWKQKKNKENIAWLPVLSLTRQRPKKVFHKI